MRRSIGSPAVTGSANVGRVIDVIVMQCADELKWRVESMNGQYFSISRAEHTELSELEVAVEPFSRSRANRFIVRLTVRCMLLGVYVAILWKKMPSPPTCGV